MTVSSTTNKVSYSGNGSTTVFAYTFKIFADSDLDVYIRSSAGTETLQTLTTDYTVSNAGVDGGGNVTFLTAPASGETVVIQRKLALTQGTDYVENDPFPAESHEEALDRLTFITQQMQEEIDRSIKASVTNTISSTEFAISAADRANKIFAFDGSGDLSVAQELGTYQGDWSASTSYNARDLVKDTSTNNIFLANTAHTSSGSQPLTTNTDSAKWDLIVDAASASASATAAAASATTAEGHADDAEASATTASGHATTASGHATTASGHATTAEGHKDDAETAKTAAESARDAALAAFDDFDDRYYGAHASDSAAETYVTGNGLTVDAGDLYFNTTDTVMKLYTGSAWVAAYVSGGSFLAAANNLSDVSSAATARTNLGLAIGTNVQAYDAGLAYLDGLNFTDESTFKAAVNLEIGTDVQAHDADNAVLDDDQTFTGDITFTGTSKVQQTKEKMTVSATAATGTINYDALTQAVLYYTTDASANWTVNVRGDGSNTLNSIMSIGEALTVVFLVTQGSTAYYNSAFQVDGSSVTPKWQGGSAPTEGTASGVDAYTYNIIKTADATFTVLASIADFA